MKNKLLVVLQVIVAIVLTITAITVIIDGTKSKEQAKEKQQDLKEVESAKGIVAGEITPTISYLGEKEDKHLFTYSVKNQKEKVEILNFPTSQRNDMIVSDQDGKIIYQYSKDKMFAMALSEEKLKPGEELEYTFEVEGLHKGSSYKVEAWLATSNENTFKQTHNLTIR